MGLQLRHITALLGSLAACDLPDDPRASWLHATLVADHQPFLAREPELVAGKFALLATAPYAFMRGTAAQYARDTVEPGGAAHLASRYLAGGEADVLLLGDPHLENLGTFLAADGQHVLDFNDFDAAAHGPYLHDVRRLATSALLAAESLPGLAPETAHEAAHAAAAAYAEAIAALAAGATLPRVTPSSPQLGALAADLLRRAREEGEARDELASFTLGPPSASRVLARGALEPPPQPGLIATELRTLAPDERDLVAAVLARYPATLSPPRPDAATFFAAKDAARRLGAGVSSYPLLRFYVLVEGATAADGDDVLLEIKEVWDPLRLGERPARAPKPFADNGERVVGAARRLQGLPALDPLLGWATLGAHAFRVRDRTAHQKGLSLERARKLIDRGDAGPDDLIALARLAGALLARAHARGGLRDGGDAARAIADAIANDVHGFAAETAAFAQHYAAVLGADHLRLHDLLAAHGPLLGGLP